MEMHTAISHTATMDSEQCDELFELAVNLAHQAFSPCSDEHVEGVYARLIWNALRGLDSHGAVTVH
ncbi:hypothetical protein H0A65_11010 [Alcaligenaceae bacterium]|nr:hypothetical protein [Alcaligenaceae bacterium]